jgi:hypothetical protein
MTDGDLGELVVGDTVSADVTKIADSTEEGAVVV